MYLTRIKVWHGLLLVGRKAWRSPMGTGARWMGYPAWVNRKPLIGSAMKGVGGHLGADYTPNMIQRNWCWPGMTRQIWMWIAACEEC